MGRTLRTFCDSCQARFLLDLDWLGRTVQCGVCRNYFVVIPKAHRRQKEDFSEVAAQSPHVEVRSAFHLLPRAWLFHEYPGRMYVRYSLGWMELLLFTIGIILLVALTLAVLVLLIFLLAQGLQNAAEVKAIVFGCLAAYWLYSRLRRNAPTFQTGLYSPYDSKLQFPYFVIQPVSFAHWLFGRWVAQTRRGKVLAELHRASWLTRLLTRRRWTVRVPEFPAALVIEESIWLPQLVRYLLLLPLGLLRLAWLLTPWLAKPFRPNYRLRLEGSDYILAENRTQLSWRDTTHFLLTPGAEQLLDWRLVCVLAALMHGDA
jgi:hypothetical protein